VGLGARRRRRAAAGSPEDGGVPMPTMAGTGSPPRQEGCQGIDRSGCQRASGGNGRTSRRHCAVVLADAYVRDHWPPPFNSLGRQRSVDALLEKRPAGRDHAVWLLYWSKLLLHQRYTDGHVARRAQGPRSLLIGCHHSHCQSVSWSRGQVQGDRTARRPGHPNRLHHWAVWWEMMRSVLSPRH
jgi:hypothetical protein